MIENVESIQERTPLLHTVDMTCRMLQMSRTTIYAAIQKGQIKIVKLGRSTRINKSEIERIAREGLSL